MTGGTARGGLTQASKLCWKRGPAVFHGSSKGPASWAKDRALPMVVAGLGEASTEGSFRWIRQALPQTAFPVVEGSPGDIEKVVAAWPGDPETAAGRPYGAAPRPHEASFRLYSPRVSGPIHHSGVVSALVRGSARGGGQALPRAVWSLCCREIQASCSPAPCCRKVRVQGSPAPCGASRWAPRVRRQTQSTAKTTAQHRGSPCTAYGFR